METTPSNWPTGKSTHTKKGTSSSQIDPSFSLCFTRNHLAGLLLEKSATDVIEWAAKFADTKIETIVNPQTPSHTCG